MKKTGDILESFHISLLTEPSDRTKLIVEPGYWSFSGSRTRHN